MAHKLFVVVLRDENNNTNSMYAPLGHIGSVAKDLVRDNLDTGNMDQENKEDLIDKAIKWDSIDPYDMGTFGPGFYDFDLVDKDGDYMGTITILEPGMNDMLMNHALHFTNDEFAIIKKALEWHQYNLTSPDSFAPQCCDTLDRLEKEKTLTIRLVEVLKMVK